MNFACGYSTSKTTFNLNGKAELHSSSDYFIEAGSVMYVMTAVSIFNGNLKGCLRYELYDRGFWS
jgi:hypothetical protein